jgi:glycosyltransferase involved in cell wall biosynthesis
MSGQIYSDQEQDSAGLPLVSVLCLTYNQAHTIKDSLDSILAQDLSFPFEIVVHDDASTDGTSEIIKEYQLRRPGLINHVRQSQNQYSRGQRILALALPHAKGRYVAICEGDDYWTDTQKLRKQIEFLENNPGYVITYHDCQPFDASGKLNIDFGGATRDLSEDELQRATPIYTLTSCFRNLINEFPPEFSTARYGDMFLWSLLGNYGKGKFILDIEPAMYRVHDAGVFSKKSDIQKLEMKALTEAAMMAYYGRIGNPVLATYFKEQLLASVLLAVPVNYSARLLAFAIKTKLVSVIKGLWKSFKIRME